jgi:hypothetical protein
MLPEKEDDEDDMLDLAFEVTETSRLGCQIIVQEEFAGTKVSVGQSFKDMHQHKALHPVVLLWSIL